MVSRISFLHEGIAMLFYYADFIARFFAAPVFAAPVLRHFDNVPLRPR
jgi:hypothetical protein